MSYCLAVIYKTFSGPCGQSSGSILHVFVVTVCGRLLDHFVEEVGQYCVRV